jgi:hypothetical protein
MLYLSSALCSRPTNLLLSWLTQHQSASDACYRSISHCTSVCVQSRGGPRAADVRASLWLERQLLLQIAAADGRADRNPHEHDIPVSDEIVHVDGRSTEALIVIQQGLCALACACVHSLSRHFYALSASHLKNALVPFSTSLFFPAFVLFRSIRACAELNRVRALEGRIHLRE